MARKRITAKACMRGWRSVKANGRAYFQKNHRGCRITIDPVGRKDLSGVTREWVYNVYCPRFPRRGSTGWSYTSVQAREAGCNGVRKVLAGGKRSRRRARRGR